MLNENTHETKKTEHKEYVREVNYTRDIKLDKKYNALLHCIQFENYDAFDTLVLEMRNDTKYDDFDRKIEVILGVALFWACNGSSGMMSRIKKLVEHYGADVNFCFVEESEYYIQMYPISFCYNIEILEYLLEHGAWINAEAVNNPYSDSPHSATKLSIASQSTDSEDYGNLNVMKWLLENGQKYGLEIDYIPQHPKNKNDPYTNGGHSSLTALESSIMHNGSIEQINLLLDYGARSCREIIFDYIEDRIEDYNEDYKEDKEDDWYKNRLNELQKLSDRMKNLGIVT